MMRGTLVHQVRTVAAWVATGVLLVPGVTAAPVQAAAAAPSGPLPIPEAPGELPAAAAGSSPEQAAIAAAAAAGEPVVVDELTTEHRLVTADPHAGQLVAEFSALPARVRAGSAPDAGWVAVDPTLQRAGDGSVRPVATAVELAFSGGGNAPLARMAEAGQWLALSWPGELPEPVLDGAVATYPDAVGPGIDLVVQAGVVGFSHYLVVRDARAAADPALDRVSLGLTTSGLAPAAAAGGATNLVRPDGTPAFVVPPARMWDSAGAPRGTSAARDATARLQEPDQARSAAMPVQVTTSAVTIAPDRALLRNPDTVFPVVIDPSYSAGRSYWTMVWSNGMSFPNSSTEQARVGYDGWSGQNKRSRVFYRFDTSVLRNREIVSARFEHKQVHSPNHDCSLSVFGPAVEFIRSEAISSSTAWGGPAATSGTASTSRTVNGHSSICGGWTRTTFDAKAAVTYAASRAHTTLTIRLRSTNESDRDGWRRFSNTDGFPKLIVSYNSPPNVPTSLHTTSPSTSCAASTNRPWVNDNSPVLRATLSSPSNQNLRGRFERQRLISGVWGGTTTHLTSYAAPGVRSDQHTGLPDGQYRWRVRAEDTATQSAYTGYCHFELDTVPPSAPTVSISAPYSLSFWVEPDGRPQATLTVGRGGDTTVDRFRYAIGSGTPTTLQSMSSSTGTVTFTPPYGLTTISARLVDRAGNEGPIATATLRVMSPRAQHAWVMDDEGTGATADLPRPVERGLPLQFGPGVTWADGNRAELGGEAWDRALRFDGTGAGAATTGPAVFELDSFTITARVRLDSADPADDRSYIAVSQDGTANSAFRMGYALASDSWAVWRNSSEGNPFELAGPAPIDQLGPGGLPFPDGQPDWQHLAMVYDAPAGEVRLYVDGNLAGAQSYTFPAAAGGAFRIGRAKIGSGFEGSRPGRTDDVVVFDTALDEAQIRTLLGAETVAHIDAQRDDVLDHGLAAGWSFGEGVGETAADWSGNGNDLSLAPGLSWVPGMDAGVDPSDRALHFDGTDQGYAETAGPVIDTSWSHSVSAWVRLAGASTATAGIAAQVGETAGSPENGTLLYYSNSSDHWQFGKRRIDNLDYDTVGSFGPPARDQWVHLVGVFELRDPAACQPGSGLEQCGVNRLYVNGQLQETRAATGPWPATGPFQLGRFLTSGGGFQFPFSGDLDEIRVYERVLSPTDVRVLHAAGTGAPGTSNQPPVAAFTVDCSVATCQFDASAASDPDGTIVAYEWNFGDGTTATGGPVVTHTYSGDATSYDVTLVVTDDDDATAELTRQVGGEPSVLVVSGPSGRAVTADDPALDVTGELDIRIDLAPDTWTPATRQVIASKGDLTSSQLSWALYIRDGGGVSFRWSFNGTTTPNHFVGWSDPGLSGRTTLRVTITSDGATGAYVTLYVGGSMDGPWDPQWAFHRAEPPTVFASTAPLTIGSNPSLGDTGFSGRIYQFQMYDGATGDLVAEPDFTTQWPQSTGFVDGAGRTWQVTGTSAGIVHQ
jgi:hypothetical protein